MSPPADGSGAVLLDAAFLRGVARLGLELSEVARRAGLDVQVYEQASQFGRVGAGIQMMPNSMKVLRAIGLEDRLIESSFAPYSHLNRVWDSGEVKRELPMPADLFGAPYLCMHRGDLHAALLSTVPTETIHLGKKLVGTRMVSQLTGAPVGFTQGFLIRQVGFGFFTGLPLIGVVIAIADIVYLFLEDHITLHDKLANTMVVRA